MARRELHASSSPATPSVSCLATAAASADETSSIEEIVLSDHEAAARREQRPAAESKGDNVPGVGSSVGRLGSAVTIHLVTLGRVRLGAAHWHRPQRAVNMLVATTVPRRQTRRHGFNRSRRILELIVKIGAANELVRAVRT